MNPWPKPDKVYFIATADRSMVKIGASSSPQDRLEASLSWSPVRLELLAVAPGSYPEEFSLHRYFAEHHSHREWYRATPELLAAIGEVADSGEIPARFLLKTEGRIPNRGSRSPDRGAAQP